jgi:hypothetical protein
VKLRRQTDNEEKTMLHMAINDKKDAMTRSTTSSPPMRGAELYPPAATVGRDHSLSIAGPRPHDPGESHRAFAIAQSTYGNQAVLRALNHSPVAPVMQRKCACDGSGDDCRACAEKKESTLQRRAGNHAEPNGVPRIVQEVLRSPGKPLDANSREFMEPRFGHDFSGVRIHTDSRAAESAQAVNALAYTVGNDLVFGSEQYRPATTEGRRLLAHELTHFIQQRSNGNQIQQRLALDTSNDALEREADSQATHIENGDPLGSPQLRGSGLQRQQAEAPAPMVYMCSKALETSPVGTHAFFRIGGSGPGNPTFSLEPVNQPLFDLDDWDREGGWKAGCWQGVPMRDFGADVSADARCEATAISLACIERQFASYPIGLYCTLGPNSNTFVGHVARNCGMSDPDPPGWNPGIDDSPPAPDTYAPSPKATLVAGCSEKLCGRGM